ncbi:hypothetical protein KI688_007616 [Linnemannia hyalina]|uniref:FAD-binding domain-containing protein n=1 Tax=Linnemannia hyalina TaxID=64524 RepID=A0A9P7XIT5_9FUNG|nr:hypothetical protein KI688_007616 [Linnemannia hyalina]
MSAPSETIQPTPSISSAVPPVTANKPPHVLIGGAGLAGLFLGILLERAGIPYEIFERSAEPRSLGAVMCLTPNILPAFEQLGLLDELLSISKPTITGVMLTDKLKLIGKAVADCYDEIGYDRVLFSRPELHAMLFKKIPKEKLHMSKKIVTLDQDQDGVTVTFDDNTTARGDILVGADGAHSSVRQQLYKTLEKDGLLPKSDTKDTSKGYICLLGTTSSLDPAKYPGVLEKESESYFMFGDKDTPYTVSYAGSVRDSWSVLEKNVVKKFPDWLTFTIPGNRICWNVIVQLGLSSTADEHASSSGWTNQDNKKMMDEFRDFKTPYGTMGDLFDVSDIEKVSRVYFEDKLFETWTHERTVLIGDAAHILLPSSGSGAANAMQDAVLLANHLYDISPTNFKIIKTALSDYKNDRFDAIKDQYPQSHMSANLIFGHTFFERVFRHVVFSWLPKSLQGKQLIKDTAYRPQANFLPLAPKRGTMDVIPQRPSKRIEKEKEEAAKKETAATAL